MTDEPTRPFDEVLRPDAAALPERYDDRGILGAGGMGEVRAVYDTLLDREVALKWMRRDREAFLEEARVMARLAHPAIVGVLDAGVLPDGACWLTMPRIDGTSLAEALREPADVARVRRWVAALRSVTDGLAHAHDAGVVHRDIKPANVMLGTHGRAWLVDWGLAGQSHGGGTPGWMAPEVAAGAAATPASDVFGLARVLSAVLGAVDDIPADLRDLASLIDAGLAEAPHERPSAATLARRLGDVVDGVRRRAEAEQLLAEGHAALAAAEAASEAAVQHRSRAASLLAAIPSWAAAADKHAGWEAEHAASHAEAEAAAHRARAERAFSAALTHERDFEPAVVALARFGAERFQAALDQRLDPSLAAEALRSSIASLPVDHVERRRCERLLAGQGRVTLSTTAPAEVEILRFEEQNRRLVAVPTGARHPSPVDLALPPGSYLARIRSPAHPDRVVRYPFRIDRLGHWDGVPPDADSPVPIAFPAVGPDDCLVPAGWFRFGGDDEAYDGVPGEDRWCDAFVMERFPITNRQYLAFLDDLVAQGRTDEALAWAPRAEAQQFELGALQVAFDGTRFELGPDSDGDIWDPDWPVLYIHTGCGMAYARWRSERDGLPWRLPTEHEWEKAARGVDARAFPWGDFLDPSWACIKGSTAGAPMPARVQDYPDDVSVYGIRGLGGNVREMTSSFESLTGERVPTLPGGLEIGDSGRRIERGGSCFGGPRYARACSRGAVHPHHRSAYITIRLVRSV